jgi:hypothetical protein
MGAEQPMSNFASFVRPPGLVAPGERSLALFDEKEQKKITRKLARLMTDAALVIPMYRAPNAYMIQSWVYLTFLKESNKDVSTTIRSRRNRCSSAPLS